MNKQYRNEIISSVHETALGLNEAGLLTKQTMKAFDEMCLTPVEELTPDQIRAIRVKEQAS
jgi:putative transcriptional regulator